jgi:DNA-binding response OmpR family regulator
MRRSALEGLSILIVEDEPLVAMDITQEFEAAGARVTTARTLEQAMILAELDGLSGAILDHSLGDGDSSRLCARLKQRGVPFVIYSGRNAVGGACKDAVHVRKPAAPEQLVAAMEKLIGDAAS